MDGRETEMLEAHVRFELKRLRGDPLRERVREFVADLFVWFADVKLDDVSSREQVMGVFDRYVIGLRVSGAMVELAGEFSQVVFTSPVSDATRLDELFDDEAYESFAEKLARLERVREELICLLARSEAAEIGAAKVLTRALRDLLPRPLFANARVRSALLTLEARCARALARQLELRRENKTALRKQRLIDLIDSELVRSVLDEVWMSVSRLPLGQLFRFITDEDLEDFVALGAEFWLRYRKSAYYRKITEAVIDHFFAKYGPRPLLTLLEDVGVSQEMVLHEVLEFLEPLLREAAHTPFLEKQLRAQLAPFYASADCAQALSR